MHRKEFLQCFALQSDRRDLKSRDGNGHRNVSNVSTRDISIFLGLYQ